MNDNPIDGWQILVVEKDETVFSRIHDELDDFVFQGKSIKALHARSEEEAIEFMDRNKDIAVLYLDCSSKKRSIDSGFIGRLHSEFKDLAVRIVIVTGEEELDIDPETFGQRDIHDIKPFKDLQGVSFQASLVSALRSHLVILEALQAKKYLDQERNIFIGGPVVVFKWSRAKGQPIEYVSKNSIDILGYDAEDFTSAKVSFYKDIIHPEDHDRIRREVQEFDQSDEDYLQQEYRIRLKNRQIIWVFSITTNIKNEKGEITHSVGYFLDNTSLKEQELFLFEKDIDGIIYLNNDLKIQKVNLSVSKMLAYTQDEMINGFIFDYFDPNNSQSLQMGIEDARQNVKAARVEMNMKSKTGKLVPCQVTVSPTKGLSTNKEGLYIFVVDLTERKEIEKELIKAIEAEKRFIASVSHEIRTPLSSILGYTELINDTTNLNDIQKRYCKNISSNSQHLLSLINDILDISKIESNQLKLTEEETAISELLSECAVMVSSRIKDQVKLKVNIPEFSYYFLCDPIRIKQIFINLLSNAAKFTNEGFIHLYLKDYMELDSDKIKLWICVEDTGIGIPDEKQKQLYQPFKQAHAGEYGGTGLGLYLSRSIAKLMNGNIALDSQVGKGSNFTVELELKKGSLKDEGFYFEDIQILFLEQESILTEIQFDQLTKTGAKILVKKGLDNPQKIYREIFRYPHLDVVVVDMDHLKEKTRYIAGGLKEAYPDLIVLGIKSQSNRLRFEELDSSLNKPFSFHIFGRELNKYLSQKKELDYDFTKLKILLVEDLKANQLLFQQMFYKFFKIEPTVANNGKEAVHIVKKKNFDLIFMDVKMPVMNGIEATEAIRGFDRETPIIALTGNVFAEDIEETKRAGMNGFLSKPIQRNDLYRILLQTLHQNEVSPSTEKFLEEPHKVVQDRDSLKKKIKNYIFELSDDAELAEEIYQTTVSEITEILIEVKNDFDRDDHGALTVSLHKLKGLLMNTGLKSQGEMIQQIEFKLKNQEDIDPMIDYQTKLFKELGEFHP